MWMSRKKQNIFKNYYKIPGVLSKLTKFFLSTRSEDNTCYALNDISESEHRIYRILTIPNLKAAHGIKASFNILFKFVLNNELIRSLECKVGLCSMLPADYCLQ